MGDEEKLGRPFERLVAAVQKKLDPGSQVYSPQVVIGRSGSRITLDAAIVGRIGSAAMLIAIEAKDHDGPVGVEKVRAFCTAIKDVGANHGIMVAAFGFTRDALLTARDVAVDTCILRPARDADWNGLIRHVSATVILMKHVFRDAVIELVDGRRVAVPEHGRIPLFVDREEEPLSFEGIVNGRIHTEPQYDNADIFLQPNEPLWYADGPSSRVAVARLRCRRERVEGARQDILVSSPSDYVFVKQTPDGEADERLFFEFKDLDQIAETFRQQ